MSNSANLLDIDDCDFVVDVHRKNDSVALQTDGATDITQPQSAQLDEEDGPISYPPAWSVSADNAENEDGQNASGRQFTVRCQGRWRVRNAPSLNSRVVGSISNGTVVFGENAPAPGTMNSQAGRSESLNCLWIRVSRFEAKESGGVSEIRHDKASGGAMYCLRRNALGYGLYETGIESLDGPLIFLPDDLATDLRDDAQRTNIERNEDVSLTWKLLSAADTVSRFFSPESGVDDMRLPNKKRAEEIFEVKQRELLKKSAGSLSTVTTKMTTAMTVSANSSDDLTAQLPKDIRSRYSRLRAALVEASANLPGTNESEPITTSGQLEADGSFSELQTFAAHCLRLERAGGWPELSHEVRQEIIHFTQKHLPDLENYARTLTKGQKRQDTSNPTSPLAKSQQNSPVKVASTPSQAIEIDSFDLLGGGKSTGGYQKAPSNGATGMFAFLPPPPAPANSVGQLI